MKLSVFFVGLLTALKVKSQLIPRDTNGDDLVLKRCHTVRKRDGDGNLIEVRMCNSDNPGMEPDRASFGILAKYRAWCESHGLNPTVWSNEQACGFWEHYRTTNAFQVKGRTFDSKFTDFVNA